MNKTYAGMRRNQQTRRALSGQIVGHFLVASVIYTVAFFLLFLIAWEVSHRYIWHGDELLYPVLHFIRDYLFLLLPLTWGIGVAVIFSYYWRKSLNYIDLIADASSRLVSEEEDLITLPPELKDVERRLNETKQTALRNARAAKEAEARKNDLIVYLAHDLKTPLTSVIGYLTLLKDEREISPELQAKYLGVALNKAERLEELINEFFEITRFNLTHITLELSRVNLTRMLEQILYEFQPMLAEKGLTCRLEAEPNLEWLLDVDKMERVFDNLIRNAVNYSFEGSEIRIQAQRKPEGLELTFCNDGNTIPEEKLARIFEQFFRLDSSRGSRSGGSGVGLAIAKEIVELHGGTIRAESAEEKITFVVQLPIR